MSEKDVSRAQREHSASGRGGDRAGLEIAAAGPAVRTRRLARKALEGTARRSNKPVVALVGDMDTSPRSDLDTGTDRVDLDMSFAMSPRYIDPTELEALQQRPSVVFMVQNATVASGLSAVSGKQASSQKEDAVASASMTTTAVAKLRGQQSWHSPVHVPLSHRKLVTAPTIFGGVAPFPPVLPHPPPPLNESKRKHKATHESPRGVPNKLTKLSPKNNNQTQAARSSEQLSSRADTQSLREKNPEIYDRLVKKFQSLRRVDAISSSDGETLESVRLTEKKGQGNGAMRSSSPSSSIESVEDAVLFFLNEKHKHDILYFKRKSKASDVQPSVDASGRLSLKFSGLVSLSDSKLVDPSIRYMPYNLERIDSMLKPEAGDYYIMSSSSLVHHANNSDDDIVGEATSISQWILESKMFSLLLAGIPLFQKFLVHKVFVWWSLEVRRRIYRDLRKRISRSLPIGRSSFVQPMLQSHAALRKIQVIRALSLPPKRSSAVNLSAVQDHHKVLLTMTETRLIDAKEELLSVMDAMVSSIQVNLDPSTNMDELYSTEANSIHMSNSKWKSAPISALRRRKATLHRQKETAKLDMSLLERYIRMMEYMFTGSVYLMIIGCMKRLAADLSTEEYSGVICASVAIYDETLLLSPSHHEMKQVVLEGVARLIRLATNFHFTKNAMAWSKNRGTGSLAVVAAFFESRTNAKSQFDLQDVLRKDFHFDAATRELLADLARWFDEAGRQMVAFESLRTIYASVHSIRSGTDEGKRLALQRQSFGSNKSGSASALDTASQIQPLVSIAKITGISGNELTRYLKSITYRFNLLDRSQHACQKIQSSWKVGFLEIQCRRSISEIFDLIMQERDLLHRTLYDLAVAGVTECVSNLQQATLVFEDRPQLIEFFCDQMKHVRALKDGEKQLHQDIRNVDEAVRALKRYTPTLALDCALQYNLVHNLFGKYSTIVQSHAKFAAKMLPLITQQVNSALQKYSARVQRLLRMYEEYSDISTEDELERNLTLFHDIVRELHSIEDASRLYQEYQRMVGLKLVEIPVLLETTKKWEEVQQIVSLAVQWRTTVNLMENGIFNEQRWRLHAEKLEAFLPRIQGLQQRKELQFAARLVEHLRTSIVDYLHKLELISELSYSYVKAHHWQQIMGLLGAVNFVSSTGILVTDGSTITLGFLRTRNVWDFETQIREITRRAQHDSVTEKKLEDMKRRLLQATLPLLRTGDFYEIDIPAAIQLLGSFEDDLLTIQALGQITTSPQLNDSLVMWAEEITYYQEALDLWISAQNDWTKLSLVFCLPDVQQSVSGATFEFQSLDRKWKSMMNATRGASSLTICLREVISLAFLNNARATFEKLWKQLHSYLSDKRRFFSRLNFLSDDDLLQLIASARYPTILSHLISKCYQGIHSLRISALGGGVAKRVVRNNSLETESPVSEFAMQGPMFAVTESTEDESDESTHPSSTTATMSTNFLTTASHHGSSAPILCQIDGVNGAITLGEALSIKPLHISSSPEVWMKDLLQRVRQSMKESLSSAMNGGALVDAVEGNFDELVKHSEQHLRKRRDSIRRPTLSVGISSLQSHDSQSNFSERTGVLAKEAPVARRFWENVPIQVLVLCMNILLTNELTALVHCDRNDSSWKSFWLAFYKKKVNLVDFMKRRDSTVLDRMVTTTLLTWMINKSASIHDLYEEHPIVAISGTSRFGVAENASMQYRQQQHEDNSSSLFRYNYSVSDSFAWTKMMRFYYEPFENKCVMHHTVKTFEYGFAYLGGYSCPVLTPLCDRVLVNMSATLSLKAGCLLHTSARGQSGKRTMAKELAATVGVECIDYNCSIVVGFDQFQRMIRGLLQSEACWLYITGLESGACNQEEKDSSASSFHLIRAFAHEMNRLKDAIHAHQEAFPLDGEMIDIVNPKCAIMIAVHLQFAKPEHQELMLLLSSAFVPVGCVHPEYELIWEAMLYASGMKHWKALSKKLTNLFLIVENHPEPFADTSLSSLHIVFAVARHVTRQRAINYLGHEEKCVLVALWDEVRSRILPARRIAFLKEVRSVFPLANTMDFTPLGMLTTRVESLESKMSEPLVENSESSGGFRPSTAGEEVVEKLSPDASPPVAVYDSDDGERRSDLAAVKELIVASMAARHLIPSESILRKFMELYHVVNRSVVTVVVGSGLCGKSSAIDVLSCVFGSRRAQQTSTQWMGATHDDSPTMNNLLVRRMKTVRLYPAAFHMSDIYGHFKESDGKAWEDGYLTHFLRQNCKTSQAFQMNLSSDEDEARSPVSSSASRHQLGSRRLSHRGSVALAKLGNHETDTSNQMTTPTVRHASTPWMVLDGVRGASYLIEPLKDIARISLDTVGGGDSIKKLVLPNGDQLHCDNPDMRLFCELEHLQQWSPACLSHFGLVYLESDHVLPYTLLIKSWNLRETSQIPGKTPECGSNSSNRTAASTIDFAAKFMRSLVSPLLEVCKRNTKQFMDFSASHLVDKMLQVLSLLLSEASAFGDSNHTMQTKEIKLIVAYASTLSFGLYLQAKARAEFNALIVKNVPELAETLSNLSVNASVTVFDVELRFEKHRATFFLWDPSASLSNGLLDWQARVSRRSSSVKGTGGSASSNATSSPSFGSGGGNTSAVSSSQLYIPTPRTVSVEAWLMMFEAAKMNAFVFGDSAVGKTRILQNCSRTLTQRENFVASTLQITSALSAQDIQSAIEAGLSRRLKALFCPGAGKRAFLITLENLNLETEFNSMTRSCSEMIRQVCDAKGSFVRASKEFAEFKDVVVWTSFSLSAFGYPRLSSRLLRHFNLIWLSDQSDAICKTILATFPDQFLSRYGNETQVTPFDISRISRLPIEIFKAARKCFKPSPTSPMLLFSIADVIKHFSLMMNCSSNAVSDLLDLELLSIHFAKHIYCTRSGIREIDVMTQICQQAARRLHFELQSLASIGSNNSSATEYLFADCGESNGFSRIPYPVAVDLFRAGEERFHWYHKSIFKDNPVGVDGLTATIPQLPKLSTLLQVSAAGSSSSSISHGGRRRSVASTSSGRSESTANLPGAFSSMTGSVAMSGSLSVDYKQADLPAEAQRRYSLVMAVRKSTDQEEFTTPSPHLVANMLDIYTFLQDGTHDLLLYGSDTSTRRSAVRIACGVHSFHFKEISAQVKISDFVDQLKTVILNTGLKSMPTLMYLDCDFLSEREFELVIEMVMLHDIPSRLYTTADKAQILGFEHQYRSLTTTSSSSSPTSKSPSRGNDQPDSTLEEPSSQTRSAFQENLKRCFYVALSFGESTRLFEIIHRHPSVYYEAGVKAFQPVDDLSLDAIFNESLNSCEPLNFEFIRLATLQKKDFQDMVGDFQAMMIEIHRKTSQLLYLQRDENRHSIASSLQVPDAKRRVFAAVRSHFEEFLQIFKLLFVFQKSKLEEKIAQIETVMQKLEKVTGQVNNQLAREVNSETQLRDAAREVFESVEKLRTHEQTEREAKRTFLLDEQRCALLQSEIEQEREVIHQELAKTLPDLMAATESLAQINKYHITEMKSFTNPPQLVRLVMQAVCVLLGSPPTWAEALRILADIRFIDRLRSFDRDHVDPSLIDRVKLYINHPDFSMENMKRASLASTTLCKWVLAIVRYFEVMKHVAPTQKKLEATERNFQVIDELVQAERKKLVDLELHINELRAKHARNLQFEEELQRSHDSRVKWKSEVSDFADVLSTWKDTVSKKRKQLNVLQGQLIEHCVIVAALITYGSAKPSSERLQLLRLWMTTISKHIQSGNTRAVAVEEVCNEATTRSIWASILKNWRLSGRTMVQELKHAFVGFEFVDKPSLMTNLFLTDQIQKVCLRYPLLLDPLDQASTWLKEKFGISGGTFSASMVSLLDSVEPFSNLAQRDEHATGLASARPILLLVLDAGDPLFMNTIEKQFSQKSAPLILIENVSECEETVLNAIFELLALVKRKDENTTFFSTKSLRRPLAWTPKIWSQFALINFSPTSDDLDTQFVSLFFQTFSVENDDSCCSEKAWRLHQKQLAAEKVREKQLFEGFLDSVLATTAYSKNRPSASNDSFPVSMWSDDDLRNSQQGNMTSSLPEADMKLITKQLEEYTAVKKKRKQIHHTLEKSRCQRSLAQRLAKRLRALVMAEEKLAAIDSSMPRLSLLIILEDMRECMESGKAEAFYTESVKLQMSCGEEEIFEGNTKPETDISSSALKLLAEQAAEFVTMRYVEKRLAGLPTSLHKKFLFLVSICIAELSRDNDEIIASTTLNQLLTSDLFREMRVMNPVVVAEYYPTLTLEGGEESRDTIAKQLAQHVVNLATTIALISFSQALQSNPCVNEDEDAESTLGATILDAHTAQLDPGVRLAYLRIHNVLAAGATVTRNSLIKRKFTADLLEDMCQSMDLWKAYLRKPPITSLTSNTAAAAPPPPSVSSSASVRPLGGGSVKPSCLAPPWVAERLTPLEKLLVHVCLFGNISIALLDDFIVSQLGDKSQMKTLLRQLDSEVNRSLVSIAKSVIFSKPILLLSNPCSQVSTGLSNVLQSAQRMGVHKDSISCVSMGSETSVTNFRLGEFSHNNLIANTNAMNSSETVRNLSGIKESALSGGGWIVVKDTEFGSLAAKNALRQQVESMKKLHANRNNDFRLWLQVELSRNAKYRHHLHRRGNQLFDQQSADDYLAHLPVERKYIEFPQSLAQYYAASLRREDEQLEQQQLQQQHQHPPQLQPRRPKLISRRSSFAKGHPQRASSSALAEDSARSSAEQSWTQAALWVFHSVFRSHLERGSSSNSSIQQQTRGSSNQFPTDLLASHFELERSLRLIQLHTRERVLAATANDASSGGSSGRSIISQGSLTALLTSDTSGYSASETRTMVELVSMLYMGRQRSNVRAKQCIELLEWCFTGKHQQSHQPHHGIGEIASGSEASAQLRNQLALLRDQIWHKKLSVATNGSTGSSGAALETRCLPLQLQCEKDVCESIDLLQVLKQSASQSEYPFGNGMATKNGRQQRHMGGSCLLSAQRSLKRILDRFPSKTSLSSSVELQRIKRHTSTFIAYQKGMRGMEPQQIAAHISNNSTAKTATRGNEAWRQALLTHLMEVELPAMETYLKYVWSMSEIILSLSSDSHDAATAASSSSSSGFYQEILSILEALSTGFVPASWKGTFRQKAMTSTALGVNERDDQVGEGGSGYAMPMRLEEWVNWLCHAVAFYHQMQIRPKHLVDVVWMPGLQHPKAFLFSLRYSVAEIHDALISEISLSISPQSSSTSSEKADKAVAESEDGNHTSSLRAYQSSRLASIAISGLYLANAAWSSELAVLVESTPNTTLPNNGRYQLLPVLELHATTHFKSQDSGNGTNILGLGGGGVSRSGNTESEQQSSRHVVNAAPGSNSAGNTTSVDLSRQVRKSDEFFYRCPLFKSHLHFATLQDPIAYMYLPTDQAAGLMTVHNAALFLSND